MTVNEQKKLSAELLNIPLNEVEKCSVFINDVQALFVSVPTKDGQSLLVGNDGAVLYGNSAQSFSELIQSFKAGERTQIEFFGA